MTVLDERKVTKFGRHSGEKPQRLTATQLFRKKPPYAHSIIKGRRLARCWIGTSSDGHNHSGWVLIGSDAWTIAKDWHKRNRLVTLLPPNEQANGFNWSCLSGLGTVLLYRCGYCKGATVLELVRQLIAIDLKVLEIPSLNLHKRAG